jgi:hypothetical protein
MGKRGQQVVVREKGATLRHAEVIVGLLNRRNRTMREGMVMA